jgi:hypothetical protein
MTANMNTNRNSSSVMYATFPMHSTTVASSTRRELMDLASFSTRKRRKDRKMDVEPLEPPATKTGAPASLHSFLWCAQPK